MKKKKILFGLVFLVSFILSSSTGIAGPGGKPCNTGGPGATNCSDSGSISILWGMFETSYNNSVSCDSGSYACCNSEGAACYPSPPSMK